MSDDVSHRSSFQIRLDIDLQSQNSNAAPVLNFLTPFSKFAQFRSLWDKWQVVVIDEKLQLRETKMTKPKIAVLIGSTRDSRFADKPAKWLMKHLETREEMEFELVDLRDFDLPLFNEVASSLYVPSQDQNAIKWQKKIAEFDGYIALTTEYNHALPGAIKNALDQAYNEWVRKPMAAMGYGGLGAARAVEQLRNVAVALQMVPMRNAIHLGGSDFFAVSPLGADGEMETIEASLLPALDAMVEELSWWAKATKAARSI